MYLEYTIKPVLVQQINKTINKLLGLNFCLNMNYRFLKLSSYEKLCHTMKIKRISAGNRRSFLNKEIQMHSPIIYILLYCRQAINSSKTWHLICKMAPLRNSWKIINSLVKLTYNYRRIYF